jgi:hypothetical protein
MGMSSTVVALATTLLTQVDPNKGTAAAQQGAAQRIAEPTMYDVVFPAIAFLLVVVLPTAMALWVLVKTLKDKPTAAE